MYRLYTFILDIFTKLMAPTRPRHGKNETAGRMDLLALLVFDNADRTLRFIL